MLFLTLCLKPLHHLYLTCIFYFFYLKIKDNIVYVSMFKDRITCRFSFIAQTDFSWCFYYEIVSMPVRFMEVSYSKNLQSEMKGIIYCSHFYQWHKVHVRYLATSSTDFTFTLCTWEVFCFSLSCCRHAFSDVTAKITGEYVLSNNLFGIFKLRALISASEDPFSACKSTCK